MKILRRLNFKKQFNDFKKLSDKMDRRFQISWKDRYPCLDDATGYTGFDRHYVYHTSWAARILAETRPDCHVDISSDIRFVTLVSAFIPIRFYDYRPADFNLSNLSSDHADLTSLPFNNNSIKSLSVMHVVEHIGLGRYGDNIDPQGDVKAIDELKRVLAVGGDLLFVVPIGSPKVMFNAHRIYSYGQIMDCFSDYELREFALIPDDQKKGGLLTNATEEMADEQTYGCGCFWFIKKS